MHKFSFDLLYLALCAFGKLSTANTVFPGLLHFIQKHPTKKWYLKAFIDVKYQTYRSRIKEVIVPYCLFYTVIESDIR